MQRDDLQRRLHDEARFQDERVRAAAAGREETRSRFDYLAEPASARYSELVEKEIEGKNVLIVGCSVGGVPPLVRLGANAIGIDISPEAIERLNRNIQREGVSARGRAMVMNAEDLEFPSESFDLICCKGVLHHLNVEHAASSWARVLKPGGRVVMMEPFAWHPLVACYRLLTPSMRTPDEHPLKPRDFSILRRYFGEVSFTGYALTSVLSLTWSYLGFTRARDFTFDVLNGVDRALTRFCPPLRYFCWSSVIELKRPRARAPGRASSA